MRGDERGGGEGEAFLRQWFGTCWPSGSCLSLAKGSLVSLWGRAATRPRCHPRVGEPSDVGHWTGDFRSSPLTRAAQGVVSVGWAWLVVVTYRQLGFTPSHHLLYIMCNCFVAILAPRCGVLQAPWRNLNNLLSLWHETPSSALLPQVLLSSLYFRDEALVYKPL